MSDDATLSKVIIYGMMIGPEGTPVPHYIHEKDNGNFEFELDRLGSRLFTPRAAQTFIQGCDHIPQRLLTMPVK